MFLTCDGVSHLLIYLLFPDVFITRVLQSGKLSKIIKLLTENRFTPANTYNIYIRSIADIHVAKVVHENNVF